MHADGNKSEARGQQEQQGITMMHSEDELEKQLGWLFSAAAERDEIAEYVLGLRPYEITGDECDVFYRLHDVVNWLASLPPTKRETYTLHLAAAIATTNRELAALIVGGVRDHSEEDSWEPLSDTVYFTVASAFANLRDYLAMRGNYALPEWMMAQQPQIRQERFCALYGETPPGHARHALRLALLSLLDGHVAQHRMMALHTCRQLAEEDPVLQAKVRERLLVAVHSGELTEIGRGDDELAASIIGTLGQWGVAEALPFLQEMARTTAQHAGTCSRTSMALTNTLEVLERSIA